jgi:hypothetical protein
VNYYRRNNAGKQLFVISCCSCLHCVEHMKKIFALALLCAGTMVEFASAQQNSFDWVRDNDQLVRLTPGLRQQMRVYDPGQGGYIKLDLNAQKPVTVAVIQRRDWNNAM